MDDPIRRYRYEQDWRADWEKAGDRRMRQAQTNFRDIVTFAAGTLYSEGFRLFENGGVPLLVRYFRDLREEILIVPAPKMSTRADHPFTMRIFLSSPEIGKVRSRFWRPAIRAPHIIAAGNIGRLELDPCYCTFSASSGLECAVETSQILSRNLLPWLSIFHSPENLRNHLYDDDVPLVDESTAVELLLALFDPYEARKFLRYRELNIQASETPIREVEGYDLATDRINPIRAYYKLGTR